MIFKRKTERPETTAVSNDFIKRYLPLMPELALKVYLCGLMLSGDPDPETDAAKILGAEENDVRAALSYLEGMGLVEIIDGAEPVVIFKKPEDAELPDRSGGTRYSGFVKEIQAVLGTRVLTGQELSRIYDWVDLFGFEKEAAVAIVKNCLDSRGAKTGVAYMDSVAKSLASKGAFTLAAVNEHFREEKLLSSGAAAIRRRWNKPGAPTMDEIALYEKWTVEWGMDEAALDYALTLMTSAEKTTFKYLDSIMSTLREEGNVDAAHIRELSRRDDEARELARKLLAAAGMKGSPKAEYRMQVADWRFGYQMSEEILLLAADYAKASPAPFSRMKEIVNGWHSEGISTVEAAKESYEKNFGFVQKRKKNSRALNYMQGKTYSKDDLKKMGISFGEEFYNDDGEKND